MSTAEPSRRSRCAATGPPTTASSSCRASSSTSRSGRRRRRCSAARWRCRWRSRRRVRPGSSGIAAKSRLPGLRRRRAFRSPWRRARWRRSRPSRRRPAARSGSSSTLPPTAPFPARSSPAPPPRVSRRSSSPSTRRRRRAATTTRRTASRFPSGRRCAGSPICCAIRVGSRKSSVPICAKAGCRGSRTCPAGRASPRVFRRRRYSTASSPSTTFARFASNGPAPSS